MAVRFAAVITVTDAEKPHVSAIAFWMASASLPVLARPHRNSTLPLFSTGTDVLVAEIDEQIAQLSHGDALGSPDVDAA